MAVYQFLILGLDVTDWVKEIPSLPISRGEIGSLVELPNIDIIVDNSKQVFTPLNPNSIFITDWRGGEVIVKRDGSPIYIGELRNVVLQNAGLSATIQSTAKINRILNANLPTYQSAQKTFAELSKDIYENQFNIETDPISYGRSQAKQESLQLQARVNITSYSESTLISIQEYLAKAGICWHYFINQVAYMDFSDPNEVFIPVFTFTDNDIIDIQNYSLQEDNTYDGYEVITEAGSAKKVGVNMIPTLDATSGKGVVMSTIESGLNWGDTQLLLSNRETYSVQVHLAKRNETGWLKLGSAFVLDSTVFGINKTFQVLGIDDSSQLGPIVTGESV